MEIAAIINYAMQALDIVPKLVAAGMDFKDFIFKTNTKLHTMQDEKRGPTPEEKKELDDLIDELRKRLHGY